MKDDGGQGDKIQAADVRKTKPMLNAALRDNVEKKEEPVCMVMHVSENTRKDEGLRSHKMSAFDFDELVRKKKIKRNILSQDFQ